MGRWISLLFAASFSLATALAAPALQQRLSGEAIDPMPMTPEQFGRFIQADIARWSALARERKISLDD